VGRLGVGGERVAQQGHEQGVVARFVGAVRWYRNGGNHVWSSPVTMTGTGGGYKGRRKRRAGSSRFDHKPCRECAVGVISFDTECGGRDLYSGVRPFLVTVCFDDGRQRWWEWDVDPVTRYVTVPPTDLDEIRSVLDAADTIVMHSSKFDVTAMATVGVEIPWDKVEDTLVADHVLNSSLPHNLTDCCSRWLVDGDGRPLDISGHEKGLENAVKTARRRSRTLHPEWRIAEEGMADLPSAKGSGENGKLWRNDYWLPRAFAKAHPYDERDDLPTVVNSRRSDKYDLTVAGTEWGGPFTLPAKPTDADRTELTRKYEVWLRGAPNLLNRLTEFAGKRIGCPSHPHGGSAAVLRKVYAEIVPHPWESTLRDYANADSATTLLLWFRLKDELEARGLWKVYRAKFESVPAAYRMEKRGVTINLPVLRNLHTTYTEESADLRGVCVGIAKRMGYDLRMGDAWNHNLSDIVFGRAVSVDGKRDENRRLSDPDTLNLPKVWETDSGNPSFDADARTIYLSKLTPGTRPYLFVASYDRRCEIETGLGYLEGYQRFLVPTDVPDVGLLHPNMNVTGTGTTRWSHSNPNSANVSERSIVNARTAFGPGPGREWYSMDAANIELRIPAYLCDERELVDIFERPKEGPYYGSYHLVIFDTLYPDLFAKYGKAVKDMPEYKTLYSCVKNGNFARQYGCQEAKADATYRVPGAYRKIGQRFPRIDALNRATIAHARRTGGVVTIPDSEVDPKQGYPIGCRVNQYGRISPTVPFAYFVSGTAGWWLNQAVRKTDRRLEEWRRDEGYDGHMILSVHDELVYDLPIDPTEPDANLPRVQELRALMESCGKSLGIPVPVTVERHRVSWAEGEAVA
jgi:DNA polymerase I-like protein with 3'-5' exonuclease and polymerase domains